VNTVVRTVGGVLGSQLTAALLAARHIAGTTTPARSGYLAVFLVAAAAAVVGGLACWAVTSGNPAELRTAPSRPA
jgi:hypothetical protein